MLVLFETAAGLALFKVLKTNKLQQSEVRAYTCRRSGQYSKVLVDVNSGVQDLYKDFESVESAEKVLHAAGQRCFNILTGCYHVA